jgi:hypothetical protein
VRLASIRVIIITPLGSIEVAVAGIGKRRRSVPSVSR